MAEVCNVKNCQRFNSLNWILGAGIVIVMSMQGFNIATTNKISDKLDNINSVQTDLRIDNADKNRRLASVELSIVSLNTKCKVVTDTLF